MKEMKKKKKKKRMRGRIEEACGGGSCLGWWLVAWRLWWLGCGGSVSGLGCLEVVVAWVWRFLGWRLEEGKKKKSHEEE